MAIIGHCSSPHADKLTKMQYPDEETSAKAMEEESTKSVDDCALDDSYMQIVNPNISEAPHVEPVGEDNAQQKDGGVVPTIEPVFTDDAPQCDNIPAPLSAAMDATYTLDESPLFPVILQQSNNNRTSSDVSSESDEDMDDYDPSATKKVGDSNKYETAIDKMKLAILNKSTSAPDAGISDVEKNESIIQWEKDLDSLRVPVICGGDNSYHDVKEGVAAVLTSAAGLKNIFTERVSSVLSRSKKTLFGLESYDALEERRDEGFEVGPGSI